MRLLLIGLLCTAASFGQTIAAKTATALKLPGYFPLYYDEKAGKLFLEISRFSSEFLYVDSLPAGVGSNDIGLDRGQLGGSRIVKFERIGPKVLLVQPNYGFRATSQNPRERASVEEAFAQSVIYGFTVEAEADGRVLVDATQFFLRDAHHVPETLTRTKQGTYRLDPTRSALYLPRTKNFPQNTEVEATLTFGGDQPGRYVREVVPSPESITVREHHSFIALPDNGYTPRTFDPRAGYNGTSYFDFGTPVSEPLQKRVIARHRLKKKDPTAALSDPVKPIIYYLDPGTPEPIRSALLEGAGWWNQAFEAAGYRNAFQVKMLPDDADPMDIRYNIIQWVHRSSRGWSYGASVHDPRTGEIIKGQVTLGSLRSRQDYLIAEGLVANYDEGKPTDPRMLNLVLARTRQLAAHEVGHTLGLSHNYIASTHNRASVMDYPPPTVSLGPDGSVDISDAYATGIGDWDKVAVTWGYQDFTPGTNTQPALDKIIKDAANRGLIFITDFDSRAPGGAHPASHLWDSGTNAVEELNRIMALRAKALESFSEKKVRVGLPMSSMEDILVPVYMYHRYQTEAAVKTLGGLDYTYAVRGDGQKISQIVPGTEQRAALTALLATLDPKALAIPERLLRLLPPRAHGYPRTREDFRIRTGVTFDALSAAESAADLTAGLLLHPERASRLVEYHARDQANPGLAEVLDRLLSATWKSRRPRGTLIAEVGRTVDNVVLYRLMQLAANEEASEQARAIAFWKLTQLRQYLEEHRGISDSEDGQAAHYLYAANQIREFEKDPKRITVSKPVDPPDGAPIGSDDCPY